MIPTRGKYTQKNRAKVKSRVVGSRTLLTRRKRPDPLDCGQSPRESKRMQIEPRIAGLLAAMTLDEKIGQL